MSNWNKILKYLFWILIISLIISVGAIFFLIYKFNSSRNLSLNVQGPKEVYSGTPFDLKVSFSNQTKEILYDSSVSIFLPENIQGETQGRVLTEKLGDIGLEGKGSTSFRLVAVGGQEELSKIKISLSYQPKGLAHVFLEKKKEFSVYVKNPSISLNILSPEKVINREIFDLSVTARNNSDFYYKNVKLNFDFPLNLKIKQSDPKISDNNLSFSLAPSEEKKIKIKASLIGSSGSFSNLKADIEASVLGQEIEINQKSISIKIASSPLEISVLVNGQEDYLASTGDDLTYIINYQNKSEVSLADVRIKAQLISKMFDFETLKTDGDFNSLDDTITWHPGNNPNLKILAPNEKGQVQFEISLKDNFPIVSLSDRNFVLKVKTEIESPTAPYYIGGSGTSSILETETKVKGKTEIESLAYFRDAKSLVLNQGPFPPKVNQPTEYTIHWIIRNYSTSVNDVEVRSVLPEGVSFVRNIKTNAENSPYYNKRTKEVVWLINKIEPARGVLSPPLEAIFQVKAIPPITMVGYYQPLIQETTLSAFDSFTGSQLSSQSPAISTQLPDDRTIPQGLGIVKE